MARTDDALIPSAATGFLAAFSGRDPAAFAEHCDPGVHYEDPLTSAPLRGCVELGEHAQRLWEAFPDTMVEPAGPSPVSPGALAVPFRVAGTHRAPLGGLPATGRRVRVHGIVYAEPAGDGRLLRVRAFFDLYDAGVQLGVMPARGGLGEKALLVLRGFGLRARDPDGE
jgi:predicted ester cyclase